MAHILYLTQIHLAPARVTQRAAFGQLWPYVLFGRVTAED